MRSPGRSPVFALLFSAVLLALLVAGCGGGGDDGGGEAGSSADLAKAFGPEGIGQLKSGQVKIEGHVTSSDEGGGDSDGGLSITGSFDSEQHAADFDVSLSESSDGDRKMEFGMTGTDDNAYVTYDGTAYELGKDRVALLNGNSRGEAEKLKELPFAERLKEGCRMGLQQTGNDPAACDKLDPSAWATLEPDGGAEVDGTDTFHYSGEVDIVQAFSDLLEIGKASLPPSQRNQIPDSFLDQIGDVIDNADMTVDIGSDDLIPRRGAVELGASFGGAEGKLDLSAQLQDINEPQTIDAPDDAQPLENLRDKLPEDIQPVLDCVLKAKTATEMTACGSQTGAVFGPGSSSTTLGKSPAPA